MMTNKQPQQTIVVRNSVMTNTSVEQKLDAIKTDASSVQNFSSLMNMKIVVSKRHSFDDNGGGYQGL